MKIRVTTTTTLVFELLKRDPFLTAKAIGEKLPQCNLNQVSAAIHHLYVRYSAIDLITENGEAFWYATPERDRRTKHLDERVPENKPRRRRKKGVSR